LDVAKGLSLNSLADNVGAHNLYIEIGLLYGLPSLICFVISIVITIIRVLKYYFNDMDMFQTKILQPFSIFVFMLTFFIFEHHGLFRLTPPLIFFLFAFFETMSQVRRNLTLKD